MTLKDNPLRLARLAAGLSQKALADAAGLRRSSLTAIERGETREPRPETLQALARALHVPAPHLESELATWRARQRPRLSVRQRAILNTTPTGIRTLYPTFRAWRRHLGLSTASLAAAIGTSRATIDEYELHLRTNGMPDSIISGLLALGVPTVSALALAELPPSDPDDPPMHRSPEPHTAHDADPTRPRPTSK